MNTVNQLGKVTHWKEIFVYPESAGTCGGGIILHGCSQYTHEGDPEKRTEREDSMFISGGKMF